jgi:hypothetical protein
MIGRALMYSPLNHCCLNLCLQGHCLGLRGGKGHRQVADSSSSVEGEGTAVPGPGVSVQESVSELLRKFGRSRGPVHNDSFDISDEPIESFSPFMTMEQVLASRDKYYRSRTRVLGLKWPKTACGAMRIAVGEHTTRRRAQHPATAASAALMFHPRWMTAAGGRRGQGPPGGEPAAQRQHALRGHPLQPLRRPPPRLSRPPARPAAPPPTRTFCRRPATPHLLPPPSHPAPRIRAPRWSLATARWRRCQRLHDGCQRVRWRRCCDGCGDGLR